MRKLIRIWKQNQKVLETNDRELRKAFFLLIPDDEFNLLDVYININITTLLLLHY